MRVQIVLLQRLALLFHLMFTSFSALLELIC